MATKRASTRRKFTGVWQEIDYLYGKVVHWFHDKGDRKRAVPFAERLASMLKETSAGGPTPFTEGAWALLQELAGDLKAAVAHRETEIRLLKRLFDVAIAQSSFDLVLAYYDYDDLSDRLNRLAALYHDTGRLDRAVATLAESQRLAARYGFAFRGQSLLENYCVEQGRRAPNGASRARPAMPRRRRTTSS